MCDFDALRFSETVQPNAPKIWHRPLEYNTKKQNEKINPASLLQIPVTHRKRLAKVSAKGPL